MAIIRYNVEVTRVDEYEIEIDDSVWTEEEIKNWNKSFQDAKKPKHIVDHLAKAISNYGTAEWMEGFGFIKQKHCRMKEGDFYTQYNDDRKDIPEEDYTKGLLVTIIQHNEDYETEIMKLRDK
jgi:hypothetical protein